MYGILSGASLNMDGVTFQHFGQALRFTDNYIDNKCVVNCTMSEYWDAYMLNQDEAHKPYAFNMGFLGDALMFVHNGVSGYANKGLLVNNCGGAMMRQYNNCRVEDTPKQGGRFLVESFGARHNLENRGL